MQQVEIIRVENWLHNVSHKRCKGLKYQKEIFLGGVGGGGGCGWAYFLELKIEEKVLSNYKHYFLYVIFRNRENEGNKKIIFKISSDFPIASSRLLKRPLE